MAVSPASRAISAVAELLVDVHFALYCSGCKLIIAIGSHNYMPCRLAQQRMTLSDLEWHRCAGHRTAEFAVSDRWQLNVQPGLHDQHNLSVWMHKDDHSVPLLIVRLLLVRRQYLPVDHTRPTSVRLSPLRHQPLQLIPIRMCRSTKGVATCHQIGYLTPVSCTSPFANN